MGNYRLYQVGQNTQITIADPRPLIAIGGDNPTPFYLFFPTMPAGLQWVFPFVYGFLFPMPVPRHDAILCDTSKSPAGAQLPASGSTSLANFNAYQYTPGEAPPAFSPGVPSVASTIVRWNILSAPSTGVQASAVKAAAATVTHVADSAIWSAATAAAPGAATESAFGILDGASTLHTGVASLQNIAGFSMPPFGMGPGLTLRGTPNNSMTVNFAGGMTGVDERVSMAGYDQ